MVQRCTQRRHFLSPPHFKLTRRARTHTARALTGFERMHIKHCSVVEIGMGSAQADNSGSPVYI